MDIKSAGPAHHYALRARGPDPARDRRPPGAGRGVGHGAVQAVRSEPARRLEAPQGAGEGGHHLARTLGAVPAVPARTRAAEGGRRLARRFPQALGGTLRPPRRPFADAAENREERKTAWPEMTRTTRTGRS